MQRRAYNSHMADLFGLFLLAIVLITPQMGWPISPSLKDEDIYTGVESALLADPQISKHLLDADVRKIVWPQGTVPNLLAKERTGQTIEAIKGVLQIKRYSVAMNITRRGGAAILTGGVDGVKVKQVAENDARPTRGVRRNLINVHPPFYATNKEKVNHIKTMFALDPYLEEKEIAVSVKDGQVHLSGSVDFEYEKARASEIASQVSGVVNVSNDLNVKSAVWTWSSDVDIRNKIKTELWWSPFVDSDEVTIDVEHGVATLTGVVDSWRERHLAEENAYEGGAKEVINRLRLRPIVGW